MEYLGRWKGYGEGHDQWEPEKNLQNAKKAIADFHRLNKNAPRRISANLFHSIDWQPRLAFTNTRPSSAFNWEEGSSRLLWGGTPRLVADDKA